MSSDVFKIFETAHGAGTVVDPYPRWQELRRECPVQEGDCDPLVEAGGQSMFGDDRVFTVLGYEAVAEALRDNTRFSTDIINDMMGPVLGKIILGMEPQAHREHRALIQQVFSRKAMADWVERVVVPVVDSHISAFERRGSSDLVADLTFSSPVFVIAGLLGLPEKDLPDFHRWSVEMICLPFDPELGMAGSARLASYFGQIIAERRADPHDDIISTLVTAEIDGEPLTDQVIIDYLRFLLEAGAETTYRSSSNLLVGLLKNPSVLEEVRNNRALLPQAVEEALRWEGPLTTTPRRAMVDTLLAGVEIPKGSALSVNTAAANRDESRWKDPDVFDIHREPIPHIAFGVGAHMCLGMHLARAETMVMMNAVLDRLEDLRLDPDADDVVVTGSTFRAPQALPVVFGPRR